MNKESECEKMPTVHIEADKSDVAPVVIMPGDPKRVEYIVNKYLSDAKLINEVRNELGYTGYYKNKKVTIFSSGMGIPSMGIYSYELFKDYDVEAIIRIGSAGSYSEELNVGDLFLVESSYSDSNYASSFGGGSDKIVYSHAGLNEKIITTARLHGMKLRAGRCHSTEAFYKENFDFKKFRNDYNCDCVEMETFSLFINAQELHKKASCILTISDSYVTKEELNSSQREHDFDEMIKLALETALTIN